MSIIKNLFIFASGVAAGSVATYFIVRKKCELEYQEKYEKDKEGFERMAKQLESDCMAATVNLNKEIAKKEAKDIIKENDYHKESETPKEVEAMGNESVRVITPNEFDEFYSDDDWNEPITFYVTTDGVIFDEDENELENPDSILVPNIESHFGEYERDSVYVRNYDTRTDYEILRTLKSWKEVEAHREKMKADAAAEG